jgi:hypothetical protein
MGALVEQSPGEVANRLSLRTSIAICFQMLIVYGPGRYHCPAGLDYVIKSSKIFVLRRTAT